MTSAPPNTPPKHVAIIMDGNGRWAKRRKLPRLAGHRAGAKTVRKTVEFAVNNNIEVLTLFALSIENCLYRPKTEVQLLMSLFLESLQRNMVELHQNHVRIRIIGDRSSFNDKLCRQIEDAEELTKDNKGLTLVIAINYSGRWDLTQAARKLALQVQQNKITPDEIGEDVLQQHLSLHGLPDPDLLIRTSGEKRISNFMLWQFAYTELFFTDVYWPDFDANSFEKALEFYQNRDRRFGGLLSEQLELQNA